MLAEHAALVDAVLEDVGLDLGCGLPPASGQGRIAADLRELRRAVEGNPAHQLRGHVVLRLAARLPDALIGLTPDGGCALGLGLHERP